MIIIGDECNFEDIEVGEVFAFICDDEITVEYKIGKYRSKMICSTDKACQNCDEYSSLEWELTSDIFNKMYKLPGSTQTLWKEE